MLRFGWMEETAAVHIRKVILLRPGCRFVARGTWVCLKTETGTLLGTGFRILFLVDRFSHPLSCSDAISPSCARLSPKIWATVDVNRFEGFLNSSTSLLMWWVVCHSANLTKKIGAKHDRIGEMTRTISKYTRYISSLNSLLRFNIWRWELL